MSVSDTQQVSKAMWGGDGAPLPSGMWYGEVDLIGDASGNPASLHLEFNTENNPRDSNIYSLEQLSFSHGNISPAAFDMELLVQNMGLSVVSPNVNALNWLYAMGGALTEGTFAAIRPRDVIPHMGLFLGSQVAVNSASQLRARVNNDNLALFTFTAMGYIWSARARSMVGGPKRPLDGLW